MYYKDFLLKLCNECSGSKKSITLPLVPVLTAQDVFISFQVNLRDVKKLGQLINNIQIELNDSVKTSIEYCVFELNGFVFDVAKQDIDILKFDAFETYPIPIFEFDKNESQDVQNTNFDFKIHVVYSNKNENIPFDCIKVTCDLFSVLDPDIFKKIPGEWSYCLEPSWNSLKMKFEKANETIRICPGVGWILWSKWLEMCKKKFGMDNEPEESSPHYLTNMDLSEDFKTLHFLNLDPNSIEENMHTYFQWKSIRNILKNELVPSQTMESSE